VGAFVAAFAIYAATANRGAQWQDSGSHILRAVTGELHHPLGLALTHPLHHWLGRLAVWVDILEPCFAVTLLSALAGAAAVANTYGCVVTLTGNRKAAVLACGSLGLAHTFWQMATLVEIYTLVAALLSAECWCLIAFARTQRGLYLTLAFAFNGLGVANHMLASLTTPILIAVMLHGQRSRAISIRHLLAALGLWMLGSLPYSAVIFSEAVRTREFWATLHSALFGRSFAGNVLNTTLSVRMLLVCAAFVALNFPNLLLPAAGYGILRGGRLGVPPMARNYLLAALIIHVLFVARYRIVDQHTFFLPTYVLLSIFGGIGFAGALRCWKARPRRAMLIAAALALLVTPVWYAVAPSVARRWHLLDSGARNKPYRDDYIYVFTPWSVVERSADIMGRHAVEMAGENGLIAVEDAMAEFAVRYRALRSGFEGLSIVRSEDPESIAHAVAAGKRVVLVPERVARPRSTPPVGAWARRGDLYVLVGESTER
jgi:hypothetical protein